MSAVETRLEMHRLDTSAMQTLYVIGVGLRNVNDQ